MASQGDPRVLLGINIVLSFLFTLMVVTGLEFIDLLAFRWRTVAIGTGVLVLITHVVVMR